MGRSILFFIIYSLFAGDLYSQDREYLDSLNQIVNEMGCRNIEASDSIIITVLTVALEKEYYRQAASAYESKARNQICKAQYDLAINNVKTSIEFFRRADDLEGEAKVLSTIANAYRKVNKIDSSLLSAKRILEIAIITKNTTLEAKSYYNQAGGFIEKDQHDSALYYSLAALRIAEDPSSSISFKSNILLNMAVAYNMAGSLEKAKEMYLRLEEEYASSKSKEGQSNTLYSSLGQCYLDLGEYDSAIFIFQKGIKRGEEIENDFMLAYMTRGMGRAYWLKHDTVKAIQYSIESKAVSKRSSLDGNLAVVLSDLTKFYTASGNYREAITQGEEGLLLTKNRNLGIRKKIFTNLAEAYEKSGDLTNSVIALKAIITLEKELQEGAKSIEFTKLQAAYETEKKEAEIASLSQQASIQALEIRQKNQALIIGLVVFLLFAVIVYFIYHQRETKKQQSQTELEQRFLRSQLNPHFISNALVAVQSFMLTNDASSATLYLTKFSKLMREILENSRKEFIPVEEEINMLKNYLDIHQMGFKDSFEYNITVDENINPEEDTIPPMFIQPFLENAIEHGIINADGKGVIALSFVKEDGYIAIEVKDNGGGLVLNGEDIESHTSLSSTIIRERMELFNRSLKNKIELVVDEIKNGKGEVAGTKVALRVPFSYI